MNSNITIGVTGGIGSGKSVVCRIITTLGYPVFYSDDCAKTILATDPDVRETMIDLLGGKAYENNLPNKIFIAQALFNNPDIRDKINALIHPKVRSAYTSWHNQQSTATFNEAAILFETGSYKNFDKTILVRSPEELRIQRLLKRDNSTVDEIKKRMQSQWPDEKKAELADFFVDNDEIQLLIPQVLSIIKELNL